MTTMTIDFLDLAAQQLGFTLSDVQLSAFEQYLNMLQIWNKNINLTAITESRAIIIQHFLDSLAISPYLQGDNLADVGTGAGFPGLPLAITHPKKQFTLIDSNGKKVRFLKQVVYELKLSNVEVWHARAEQVQDHQFSTVITRAFADLASMVQATAHLCDPSGCWLAMKGRYPEAEIAALPTTVSVQRVVELQVPELDAKRHVVIMQCGDKT